MYSSFERGSTNQNQGPELSIVGNLTIFRVCVSGAPDGQSSSLSLNQHHHVFLRSNDPCYDVAPLYHIIPYLKNLNWQILPALFQLQRRTGFNLTFCSWEMRKKSIFDSINQLVLVYLSTGSSVLSGGNTHHDPETLVDGSYTHSRTNLWMKVKHWTITTEYKCVCTVQQDWGLENSKQTVMQKNSYI